jgi:PAS domain S-box-containing protein
VKYAAPVRGVVVIPHDPVLVAAARDEHLEVDSGDDVAALIRKHDPAVVVVVEPSSEQLTTLRASRTTWRGAVVAIGSDVSTLRRDGADDVLCPPFERAEAAARIGFAARFADADRSARSAEDELLIALRAARIGTWEVDVAKQQVRWSEIMHEVMAAERPVTDLEGSMATMHPEDRPRILEAVGRMTKVAETTTTEFRILDRQGRPRTVQVCGTAVRDREGNPRRLLGTAIDVTERKEAESTLRRALAEMRESDERFRIVARATSDLVWDWDLITDFVSWSDNIETLFGYTDKRTPIEWWEEVMHPDDRGRVADGIRSVIELGEENWDDEYRMKRADGSYATVIDRGVVIHDRDGKPVRMIGAIMDITERRELQARLLLADRMASVGTLAAGVAHEINNPLAYVIANVDLATQEAQKLAQSSRIVELLRESKEGAERVRRIVGDLKTFSRADDAVRERVDLRVVVESSINLAMNEIRHRAQLVRELDPVPRVDANAGRLGQVVVNLLVNAAQAIEEGAAGRNKICVRTRTDEAGRAVLEIEDTGPGMPPEIRARIFDPFYTTKQVGEGTGLGLTICHGIVAALNGSIEVESEVGKGSLFRVVLPAARESDRVARPVPSLPVATEPRRGRVLVVDDEAMIGKAVQLMLEEIHDVVALVSAREALERLTSGEAFDAVVCDLMMPEMTGMDLYAEVQRRLPDQAKRFVFLTGGAFTPRARAFLENVHAPRLDKPFEGPALVEAIAIAMRRSPVTRAANDRGT